MTGQLCPPTGHNCCSVESGKKSWVESGNRTNKTIAQIIEVRENQEQDGICESVRRKKMFQHTSHGCNRQF